MQGPAVFEISNMQWQFESGVWVLTPPRPRAVVHFLGGAFVGGLPHLIYDGLLARLARVGCAIAATPYPTYPDHAAIAKAASQQFRTTRQRMRWSNLPAIALGHSLGCKLHLLDACRAYQTEAASAPLLRGAILMAYSNASFRQALPWGGWVPAPLAPEFSPTPQATERAIVRHYPAVPTLAIAFERDDIADMDTLHGQLQQRLGDCALLNYQKLAGDHGTSAGSRYPFAAGQNFSPADAIGQWLYQSLNAENERLAHVLERWLCRHFLAV